MSMFKRFSALFLAALLVSACATTPKQESTGEYIDDSWGVVQLSGFVDSAAAGAKAAELAGEVKGVSSVKNDTRIR